MKFSFASIAGFSLKLILPLFISALVTACGGGGGGSDSDTAQSDTTPDPISFTSQVDVPLSSVITSNTVQVSGINAEINVSIIGGEYSINDGMFVSSDGTVNVNDQIKVRHSSSSSYNSQKITNLFLGDQTFDFVSTTVISGTSNTAPIADAGADQSIITGNAVFLDGGASSDTDGDSLSYLWALDLAPNGSGASLNSHTTSTPSITPDLDGTYTISLVVNDGTTNSSPDTVNIVASSVLNTAPIADAGADQSIITGNAVFLDGGASSDADGDSLSYLWALDSAPNGSGASINSNTTHTPSITPDLDGTYTVSLVVNDGKTDSSPDIVNIVASSVSNAAPAANAGADMIAYVGTTVFLDGSVSHDDDGDTLTYQWTGIAPQGSSATLFAANTAYPYFSPDVVGTYTLSLTVNDGAIDSAKDTINVTAVALPVSSSIVLYSGSTYLGCWSCNEFDTESIHNSFGQYGSEYGTYSIRNDFGQYGSSYSSTSACNTYATSPPVIVDGTYYYGTVSINTYNTDSICNRYSSFYSSTDCAILQNYCANL